MRPTAYRITVRGEMGPRLASCLAPLECSAGGGRTLIEGIIQDQSHLFGVLARIRDLGLDLVEVVPQPAIVNGQDSPEGGARP